ncbi:multidrug resistance-associated ABC transporter [Exidia glandulosa HHB12029]|uniref:Multidrug resistance-associated ABC transporter n=1 Tax=Exidia glandulosa HHB12029 TaxID=1314781 RepID=A0A165PBV0_EXIGL|nr:multidrug resistance-associated ABC transporter [Exidia glandulosa HHB12029]
MGALQSLYHAEPAPPALAGNPPEVVPEASASLFSHLTFGWITPVLKVGYSRTLEKDDLWQLDEKRRASHVADELAFAYDRARHRSQLKRESKMSKDQQLAAVEGAIEPDTKALDSSNQFDLLRALHSVYFWQFWASGFLSLLADGVMISSPLLTKEFLSYLTAAYMDAHYPGSVPSPPSLQYGMGLAAALAGAQFLSTVCATQAGQISLKMSMSATAALNAVIFRKTLRMSPRARVEHSKGQITTLFSEDSEMLIGAAEEFHTFWVAPIQLGIGIYLLYFMLGSAGMLGMLVVLLSFPAQGIILSLAYSSMLANMKATDARTKLMQEVLNGVRSIKIYAWERFFEGKIGVLRNNELKLLRRVSIAIASLIALNSVLPVASNTVSFVVYSITGHTLTPAVVFGALQIFGMIRQPLVTIPGALTQVVQARINLQRIAKFLNSEENAAPFAVDETLDNAVNIDADFTWEEQPKTEDESKAKDVPAPPSDTAQNEDTKKAEEAQSSAADGADAPESSGTSTPTPKPAPFALSNLKISVPKGSFVAIVGRVGSGKSSLMEALAGEMRKTRGEVTLGGSVAYAPQTPWIVNATVKDNVVFGEELDDERYGRCLRACALDQDIETLSHKDNTEIGERGITLSGGQKARVSLARTAYSQADIVLLDDPLSAVDAHVGKHILKSCLLSGPLSDRTRILSTHALHVLPFVDYIYVLERGTVAEQGTYKDLRESGGAFARLVEEHGSKVEDVEKHADELEEVSDDSESKLNKEEKAPAPLMQDEDQEEGQVPWSTYQEFFTAAGSRIYLPLVLLLATAFRAAMLANTLFLGWWSSQRFPDWTQKDYIVVYTGLGVAVGLTSGLSVLGWMLLAIRASKKLFTFALDHVLRSPVTFFDTTPMGRIVSRLTKDVRNLDFALGNKLSMVVNVVLNVITTLGLVIYMFPVLAPGIIPLAVIYVGFFFFYRRTSVTIKRLASTLRSATYIAYNEPLSGLSTVRATRQEKRFIRKTEDAIDLCNRANYVSLTMAQWLQFRLSLLGTLITLGLAVYAVTKRKSENPSDTAVVLTYVLSITGVLAQSISAFVSVEQDMVAVQRILRYTRLPVEGEGMTLHEPPASWPQEGAVEFKNVDLAYREGLPDVLRDVTFQVKPGEKVGICGRTGAGKSSLMQALLRTFEIKRGTIIVDDQDLGLLDIEELRSRLGVIPQDSIFLGTVRECIDPQSTRTDAELLQILQHAHLVPASGADATAEAKFALDASIGDDGSGISAGEKQQLALCRVLVKRSKIVILDEATSNVDLETDAKLQQTIRTELASSTLLTIAHRLKTIVAYDRVLVMDKGEVAEFDAPLALFDKGGIFRNLCDEASISRDEIVSMRRAVQQEPETLIALDDS